MALWEATHNDDEARVRLSKLPPQSPEWLNQWMFRVDGDYFYLAETERQCREALIARLDDRIRAFQSIIAEEKSRLV